MKKRLIILFVLILMSGCSKRDNNINKKNLMNNKVISEEELKSYITKIDVLSSNWTSILFIDVDYHEEVNNFGESIYDPYEVSVDFKTKPGFVADMNKIGLKLIDTYSGKEIIWENLKTDPVLYVYHKDDRNWNPFGFIESIYNENEGMIVYGYKNNGGWGGGTMIRPFIYVPTDISYITDEEQHDTLEGFMNIICEEAGGYVYQLDVPEELIVDGRYVSYTNSYGNVCDLLLNDFFSVDLFMNE